MGYDPGTQSWLHEGVPVLLPRQWLLRNMSYLGASFIENILLWHMVLKESQHVFSDLE